MHNITTTTPSKGLNIYVMQNILEEKIAFGTLGPRLFLIEFFWGITAGNVYSLPNNLDTLLLCVLQTEQSPNKVCDRKELLSQLGAQCYNLPALLNCRFHCTDAFVHPHSFLVINFVPISLKTLKLILLINMKESLTD